MLLYSQLPLDLWKGIYDFKVDVQLTKKNLRNYASTGNLKALQWIHKYQPNHACWNKSCWNELMDWAAENGHLKVVQWLHENRTEGCTTTAMNVADRYGHFEVVQWLRRNQRT